MILLVAIALAGPEDALDPITRTFWERAVAEEEAGRAGRAADFYRMVLSKDPGFVPAALGLGRALEAGGDRAEAEQIYRAMPSEPDAVEALARLIEGQRPGEALSLWRSLRTLRLGDPGPHREVARLLTPSDPLGALDAWRTHLALLEGSEPDGDVTILLGGALLDGGHVPEGEALWREYLERWPDGAAAGAIRERLDHLDVARAAELRLLVSSEPLSAALATRHAAAERALAAGRVDDAVAEARLVAAQAPRSADAHGLLADALLATGAYGDAESHALLARDLAPDEPRHRLRLGLLLHDAYGGRRADEAAAELRKAARLRPGEGLIRYHLGLVEQDRGDWDAAVAAYDTFLATSPEGPEAEDARRRVAALRRPRPPAPAPLRENTRLPPEAVGPWKRFAEYVERGRAEDARRELELALAIAPDAPELLNARAELAQNAGEHALAEASFKKSLKVDPSQAQVWISLGDMARDREVARACYAEAARIGSADARFLLAKLAAERGDWSTVRAELDAFDDEGGARMYDESASLLRERVEARLLWIRAGGGVGVAAALGLPLVWWLRRRSARTLRELLDGAPESWHESARLLSGLRHEVLKHNTTVLPDVAAALARGDRGPWDAIAVRMPELLERFGAYLGAIEALGRRHGMRVDLRGKDPVIGPMWRAMRKLARARRPPDDLLALSETINGEGYRALGRMVREICVLPVDEGLARAVYARVAAEPGFAGSPVPELGVDVRAEGLAVRMFRAELEDILANLLRNALAAGARTLTVVLASEDDPITGQEWVELHVRDDAPGSLNNAMIRSRFIGRGLGLAVDLVNKHGGTISVAHHEGEKSVVVQLPGVEAASVEVEWTA
ncbi:MAG: tetratricopeptide repeat protein [Myxococcota bacterium]